MRRAMSRAPLAKANRVTALQRLVERRLAANKQRSVLKAQRRGQSDEARECCR